MGHVDPLKEVNAAEKRIANNITTQEQEASEYNGNDWNANIRQRKKEIAAMQEAAQADAAANGGTAEKSAGSTSTDTAAKSQNSDKKEDEQ